MYRFISRENIRHFQRQLEECTDERQRKTLLQLLAVEEKRLEELECSRCGRRQQQALEVEESQAALRESMAETEKLVSKSDEMLARHHREREQDDSQGWAADG